MSLDYPDYLKIKERSRLLGWIWRVGDIGYYVGLIGAIISFFLLGVADSILRQLTIVLAFVGLFLVSSYLKGLAHSKSGIHDFDDREN